MTIRWVSRGLSPAKGPVKGGGKARPGMGRSKTGALAKNFCGNGFFLTDVGGAAGKAFSVERKESVSQYGTVASDPTKGITPGSQQPLTRPGKRRLGRAIIAGDQTPFPLPRADIECCQRKGVGNDG